MKFINDVCGKSIVRNKHRVFIRKCDVGNNKFNSSGATALQGFGRQSSRRRSANLVPTFADRGVSRGQRNGSPQPIISVYRTWIATYFIQVAPQLNILNMVYNLRFFLPLQNEVCFIILTYFGSCIIRILRTGCAKIKKKIIPAPKV